MRTKKRIANKIANISHNTTLAGILHKRTNRTAYGNAYNLRRTYEELMLAIADTHLLNAIALHCELHETPPTPEQIKDMAREIYSTHITPPTWNFSSRLRNTLQTHTTTREETQAILKALDLEERIDCRRLSYPPPTITGGDSIAAPNEPTYKNRFPHTQHRRNPL